MRTGVLEEIGLTKSEVNTYLALLELGSSSTGKIVDKSGVSSSKIYEILDRLIQKGLVSFIIKSGVKYFEAAPPERIMDYMKEKEESINKQKDELKKILPELDLKQKLSKFKSEATIFKGLKGGETAFRYMINKMTKDDEWLGFVIKFSNREYFNLLTKIHSWRAKKGLKSRLIFNESGKEDGKAREKLPNTKVRYVPDEVQTPAIVNVAGNVALLNIMAEEVTVFMIESKEVADSFRNQFERLWNQDTTVRRGIEALDSALNEILEKLGPEDTYDVLGAAFGMKRYEKKYTDFFRKFHEKRIERGIKGRLLFQQGVGEVIEKYLKGSYNKAQIKFLPYSTESPVAIFPSRDKTLLLIQKEEPTIITINNKEVAKSFKKHFESLWNQDVNTYRGFKAVTDKFTSMLGQYKPGDEYYVLGANYGKGGTKLRNWFVKYHRGRLKKGIIARLLSLPDCAEEIVTEFKKAGDIKMELGEIRTMPPMYSSPMQINLYQDDKVLLFIWEEELICIEIISKVIYKNFKGYFDILWNLSEKAH